VLVCFDDDDPARDHSCTDKELELMANDGNFQSFIHGCDWHGYTRYVVLDKASGRYPLSVTVYDDLESTVRDGEEVSVSASKAGLRVRGPNCSLDLSYRGGD
jgi:hypothetical protein